MPGRNPSQAPIGRNPSPRIAQGASGGRPVYMGNRDMSLDQDPSGRLLASAVDGDLITWQVDTSPGAYALDDGPRWYLPLNDFNGSTIQDVLWYLQSVHVQVVTPPPDDCGLVIVAGVGGGQVAATARHWWGGVRWQGPDPRSVNGNTPTGYTSGTAVAGVRQAILHAASRGFDGSDEQRRVFAEVSALAADGTTINVSERTGTTTIPAGGDPLYLFVGAFASAAGVSTTTPTVSFRVRSQQSPRR